MTTISLPYGRVDMDKLQLIKAAKADTAALQSFIASTKEKIMDTTLPRVAMHVPPISPFKLRQISVYKGHRGKVHSLALSKDDSMLVSVAQDGFLLVWDSQLNYKLNAISLASSWVLTCACSPSGSLIASGGLDNTCTIYSTLAPEPPSICSAEYSPPKSPKSPGSKKTVSKLYPQIPLAILKGHRGHISSLEYLSDSIILSASGDMTIGLWDITKQIRTHEYLDHLGDVNSISKLPHNQHCFISGSSDRLAKLWDIRTNRCVQTFPGNQSDVNVVKALPNDNTIATGSDDSACRIFDLRSDCQLCIYESSDISGGVTSMALSPSGRLLFASYEDEICAVWDILKGEWVAHVLGHEQMVSAIQVSNNGSRVYTSSWDSTVSMNKTPSNSIKSHTK